MWTGKTSTIQFYTSTNTITTSEQQPIMVALQNLSGSQIVQWNVQMAGALLAALPTILVYIFLGKYFVRGLLAGSVKG
jgi:ABC-type glycerol-3-phosphate transport system permease component